MEWHFYQLLDWLIYEKEKSGLRRCSATVNRGIYGVAYFNIAYQQDLICVS